MLVKAQLVTTIAGILAERGHTQKGSLCSAFRSLSWDAHLRSLAWTAHHTLGLLRLHPSGFDESRCAFALALYKARELGLRHAHRLASVLRDPVTHIRR